MSQSVSAGPAYSKPRITGKRKVEIVSENADRAGDEPDKLKE